MEREFTFTKEKLRVVLRALLEDDVRGATQYLALDRAEEGFEKRAVLEFLGWFIEEAFPDGFSFACRYEGLEDEYPEATARRITEGRGWAKTQGAAEDSGKVVVVDFRSKKR